MDDGLDNHHSPNVRNVIIDSLGCLWLDICKRLCVVPTHVWKEEEEEKK